MASQKAGQDSMEVDCIGCISQGAEPHICGEKDDPEAMCGCDTAVSRGPDGEMIFTPKTVAVGDGIFKPKAPPCISQTYGRCDSIISEDSTEFTFKSGPAVVSFQGDNGAPTVTIPAAHIEKANAAGFFTLKSRETVAREKKEAEQRAKMEQWTAEKVLECRKGHRRTFTIFSGQVCNLHDQALSINECKLQGVHTVKKCTHEFPKSGCCKGIVTILLLLLPALASCSSTMSDINGYEMDRAPTVFPKTVCSEKPPVAPKPKRPTPYDRPSDKPGCDPSALERLRTNEVFGEMPPITAWSNGNQAEWLCNHIKENYELIRALSGGEMIPCDLAAKVEKAEDDARVSWGSDMCFPFLLLMSVL